MNDFDEEQKKDEFFLNSDEKDLRKLFGGKTPCPGRKCMKDCLAHYKIAKNLALKNIKAFMQEDIDNSLAPAAGCRKTSEFFDGIGNILTRCLFGYRYGSHPDKSDAQLLAAVKNGTTLPSGSTKAPAAASSKTDLKPDLSLKPDYKNNEAQKQADIKRLRELFIAEATTEEEMKAVAAVIMNRFRTPTPIFDRKSSHNTYSEIIDAEYPGYTDSKGKTHSPKPQFQGFTLGKTPQKVINEPDGIRKDLAQKIAEQVVNDPHSINPTIRDKDGIDRYPYSFMSQASNGNRTPNPGGNSKKIELTEEKLKKINNNYFYY